MNFRQFFISYFPFIGKYKRFFVALIDSILPLKKTYSQNNEDKIILDLLKEIPPPEIGYIDVGSNHPTDISNTYLLYCLGYCGYLIEPNKELCNLSKFFRRRDKIINIGLGITNGLMPFYISRTPIGSSFDNKHLTNNSQLMDRVEFVPVLRLDDAFRFYNVKSIGLLSIDVEGWNFEVVQSAEHILSKVFVLCVEYDNIDERANILAFLKNFRIVHDNGCNLIMQKN